ncbi:MULTISPECIES: hypothetical protein [Sphingobium]|uniref:hypothetical protein n=1 Tax=Sphingobium TaxID=165695 RepID=UPI00242B067B|nr:hypothetical protein [Sphingobium yanoikuyae]
MNRSTLPLHRRTRTERRVLAMLRGEEQRIGLAAIDSFARLRRIAIECGLRIQPPGARYVSDDELVLLASLADAQRLSSAPTIPLDERLTADIRSCAELLIRNNLRLSPLTLYSGRGARQI